MGSCRCWDSSRGHLRIDTTSKKRHLTWGTFYRDADPQLLGYAMTRELGQTEEELAKETLFDALGIVDYYWEEAPRGENLAAHGLHLLPR